MGSKKEKKRKDRNRNRSKGQRDREAISEKTTDITNSAIGYGLLTSDVQTGNVIVWAEGYGRVTLDAATSTVVEEKSIEEDDDIFLQAQNAAGAALGGVFIDPDNIEPGESFRIDHVLAAGTEVFAYQISR